MAECLDIAEDDGDARRPPDFTAASGSRAHTAANAATLLTWLTWPLLALASCAATAIGLRSGLDGSWIVAIVFLGLAASLQILERVFPHEPSWVASDGQVVHDVVFTLVGSGLPGALAHALVLAVCVGAAEWLARQFGSGLWPSSWPVPLQVALTVAIADFGSYWGHRAFHEVPWLWPYHAVHHSVPRLWWLNSGRNHPVDAGGMILFSIPLLVLLGVPEEMMVWLGTFTTFVGLLSHCNVRMECGPLDWIFNTPGVHRWHHSRVPREGNTNYGENTMIWDVVFGTHYRHAHRRPPVDIGTSTFVPLDIAGQFLEPFRASVRSVAANSSGR